MNQLRVHPKALLEMETIAKRIGKDNPAAADRWLLSIEDLFNTLVLFPKLAPPLSIHPGWRTMPFGSYRLLYREITNGVEIVRVIHAARDIEAALDI